MRPSLLATVFLLAACTMASGALPGQEEGDHRRYIVPTLTVPEKNVWPELVGRPCAEAKAAIEAELPGVRCFVVPEHSMVTMDFQTDRVRIFCSRDSDTVASPPRIG